MKLFASPKTKKPTRVDKKKLLTRLIVVLILVIAIFNTVGMVQQEPTAPRLSVAPTADATTSQVLGTTSQTGPSIDSLVGAQKEKSKTARAIVIGLAYIGTVVAILAIWLAVRRLKDRSF